MIGSSLPKSSHLGRSTKRRGGRRCYTTSRNVARMVVSDAVTEMRADTEPVIGAAFGATLAQAQRGDEEAFARLFRDVQPTLLGYLRIIAPEAADDVAGETWLNIVAGLAKFTGGEEAFRAWLFTIARHRAADLGRSRARRRTVPLDPSEAGERLAPDAADVALERISTHAVLSLIAALPADQAEIIMLRVVAGLDTHAVAKIVGKRPGAVRVAAHRALRRLATRVDRAGVL
jgi:RNA polymerase sigma-70 factor (ECF subfamily)